VVVINKASLKTLIERCGYSPSWCAPSPPATTFFNLCLSISVVVLSLKLPLDISPTPPPATAYPPLELSAEMVSTPPTLPPLAGWSPLAFREMEEARERGREDELDVVMVGSVGLGSDMGMLGLGRGGGDGRGIGMRRIDSTSVAFRTPTCIKRVMCQLQIRCKARKRKDKRRFWAYIDAAW
jgi:hypothetical protein